MPGQYKYKWDLIAGTTQFEQNMVRAAEKARKLSETTQKATSEITRLTENAGKGGEAVEKVTEKSGRMGEQIATAMSSVASGVGGTKGEVIGLVAELAAATGPLALITAGVAGIALAWKISEENVKSYLDRVDKTKLDPAIFTRSSTEAYNDTRKAANGGISVGTSLINDADRKLESTGKQYTAEQKKQLVAQKEFGYQLVKDNAELKKTLGYGADVIRDNQVRFDWIQRYNKLQSDNAKLEEDKLKTSTEVINMESELLEIKYKIMGREGSVADQKKLESEYEAKAKLIADKKLELVDREFTIKNDLYKLTGESEKASLLSLNTENEKAAITQQYNQDLVNTLRLVNSIGKQQGLVTKSVEEQLKAQKEFNTTTEAGYKFGTEDVTLKGGYKENKAGYANTGQLLKGADVHPPKLVTPEDLTTLRKYSGLTREQIENIVKTNAELEREQEIADSLGNVFMDVFSNIDGGFEAMAQSLIRSLEQIAAKLAAQAALFALMSILFPEGAIAAGGLGKFLGLGGLIPGLAEGGLAYGPTIAQVGEYGGARSNPEVIAPLSKLQSMLQPTKGLNGVVRFEIGNRVITGVLEQEGRISRNIRGK